MSMKYITEDSDKPGSGPRKYYGNVASGYDAKREKSEKWIQENRIVLEYLSTLDSGAKVLDVPVGTGRFVPYAEVRRFEYLGVDISDDMIKEASKKVTNPDQGFISLFRGSILESGGDVDWDKLENTFDCSMMIRMTRWLTPEECMVAMHNLMKVTKDDGRIIFTYREDGPHARPAEMWSEIFMGTGWGWFKNEPAAEDSYRVAQIRKN
jgi:ubiquinone/menaquinone biosynthesis C-methylase UbiE